VLVLELKEVVLPFKEAHAAVDGNLQGGSGCFIFTFHSKSGRTTGESILSIVETIIAYCPAIHITSSIAIRTLTHPGSTCQDWLDQKLLS